MDERGDTTLFRSARNVSGGIGSTRPACGTRQRVKFLADTVDTVGIATAVVLLLTFMLPRFRGLEGRRYPFPGFSEG